MMQLGHANDCDEGVCQIKPDCVLTNLTEDECDDLGESHSRGLMIDANKFIERPWALAQEAKPQNTESLLPNEKFTIWAKDQVQLTPSENDEVIYQTRILQDAKTIKLSDVVEPIQFESGSSEIPDEFIEKLRSVLENMRDRVNVRLHVIGHTDDTILSSSNRALYGDNVGLSEARAQMAAEFFQRSLGLPPESVSFEGRGSREAIASNENTRGRDRNRRVEVEVWYDELSEKIVEEAVEEKPSFTQLKVCRVVERCIYKRRVGNFQKIQLINAIKPVRYQGTQVEVSEGFLTKVAKALDEVSDMPNVGIRVIGHTDNQPLTGAVERIYGDNVNLSKALANRVARSLQDRFRLRNDSIIAIGKGETAPLASNTVASGRNQNRRVEVEIWHDDPRGEQVSEPRMCPEAAEAEVVTVPYQDERPIVPFKNGQPAYPNGFLTRIQRIFKTLENKGNIRINFIGHTTNERLTRRAATIYSDHFGLSEARAIRVRNYLQQELKLDADQLMYEGRGFLEPLNKPDDSPFSRKVFTRLGQDGPTYNPADARVEIEFLYDEAAELEQDPNIEITPTMVEQKIVSPFALHPIRVSVDGETIDSSAQRHTADVQRCTDIALDTARIQLRHDSLSQQPRLNIQAIPAVISFWDDSATRVMENKLSFQAYSNYSSFIQRAEVRIFTAEQSLQSKPLEVIPLDKDLFTEWWWIPEVEPFEGPVKELRYQVRVYDDEGRYDETTPKLIWVVNELSNPEELALLDYPYEQNVIYGESHLAKKGIPLKGNTITVSGQNVPPGDAVWVMGEWVPVSASGGFIAEQIVPDGLHTIEVAVLNEEGNGRLYLRDLRLKESDWFVVGIADLTLGQDDTEGPASLVTQDDTHYESEFWADGRLAFYTKGKAAGGWTITGSADSREEPIEELFSNLDKKDPDSIFRRLDPDYYYPAFGDDSTTVDDAPTSGKFYVKAQKNKSYGMWGNFKAEITDTDLAQIDRALYGASGHYESLKQTQFGESKTEADVFVAEPGTILGREEFRGTGGSLYFLNKRDVTQGSERLRIEIRDRDSDLVLQTENLLFGQDYDIDYIQGRILLNQILPSTADDNLLVQDGALSGNPVYLVVRYEFTPGFDDLDDTAQGGRVAHWFNDYIKFGTTISGQEQLAEEQELSGIDITLRKTPGTYIKLESANTKGPAFGQSSSFDGGFSFTQLGTDIDPNKSAGAQRLEVAAQLQDLFNVPGQVTLYTQTRDQGFSAPGQLTNTDVDQAGATADIPIGEKWSIYSKMDKRDQAQRLSTQSIEVDTRYKLTDHWRLSSGLRIDERIDNSIVTPETQTQGDRTDLSVEAMYDSLGIWNAYSYIQSTLETTETRRENDRVGLGGKLQISNRTKLDAEVSGGDGGTGSRVGLDYMATDRTSIYMAYLVDSDRSDTGYRGRNGRSTLGFRSRYSDSLSVYGEERYSFGDQPTGLTHAYGVDIAPYDKWTVGLTMEAGTLVDNLTAAQTERTAIGLSLGYASDRIKYATAIESREDQTDLFTRSTILLKNNLAVKLNPNWRTTVKLNLSESESSQGEFYDGDFTEFAWGYAYRPIYHDRLNMLFKYTFFENLPAANQQSVTGTITEFIQRSNIYSFDATYDLTKRWTLGGKYGKRIGEVSLDRVDPQFFSSNADLMIVRADWHVVKTWDWLIEARALAVEEAQDTRSGFLTAFYKHMGNNIKVGVGYNFTDFSDDLTDLDFDSQGLFINLVGKM